MEMIIPRRNEPTPPGAATEAQTKLVWLEPDGGRQASESRPKKKPVGRKGTGNSKNQHNPRREAKGFNHWAEVCLQKKPRDQTKEKKP